MTRFQGDHGRLNTIYEDLFEWLDRNGYERNTAEGVYWIEPNLLKPVNPFDIHPSKFRTLFMILSQNSPDMHLIIGYHAHLWYMYKGR
ncbi:hypothetical protein [Paenibacillus sp. NPDC055715]